MGTHRVKPILDFGFIQVPTFYLVISLSITFVLLLVNAELNQNPKIDRKITFDIALIIMLTGFVGGRLAHVFYEEFAFYQEFPLEVFKFWKGGFVFYGGFILSLISVFAYLRAKKQNFYFWADFLTPYLALSYALGRIGCFFEGCCYGTHCELPWAVAGRHPTQLYMVVAELILIMGIVLFSRSRKLTTGLVFLMWVCGHSINRFVIEFYREDDRGALIMNLSISQILSALLFLGALYQIKKLLNFARN
ncbi:prolipoprotein diacylglyceryl transferase [Bdellovibrio sp. qaytius]|nr:prolipoprotein diacylglyceryl transferase [Bdellovibrio sp. qaytius]